MEDTNKVTVKIYGQEYTIAGDSPRDYIMKVADYVDERMHEIAKALPHSSMSVTAVLAAINVTDDYFAIKDKITSYELQNEQLQKDTAHYVQLWDEAKKSFLQYKEDAQGSVEQLQDLQKLFNEKTVEAAKLAEEKRDLNEKYQAQVEKNEDLIARMQAQEESKENRSSEMRELELKCKEMESSFFDLQMENIQLKGEVERYKKIVE